VACCQAYNLGETRRRQAARARRERERTLEGPAPVVEPGVEVDAWGRPYPGPSRDW
jgi:hypothetical protein